MSNFDPTDIQAQERDEAVRKDQQKSEIKQEVEDFKWLMSDKRGRRIVWGLLERSGLFRTSMTGNSWTFFNEGVKNEGLRTFGMIQRHCPERYEIMVKENIE